MVKTDDFAYYKRRLKVKIKKREKKLAELKKELLEIEEIENANK
jgi:hypothetical protein